MPLQIGNAARRAPNPSCFDELERATRTAGSSVSIGGDRTTARRTRFVPPNVNRTNRKQTLPFRRPRGVARAFKVQPPPVMSRIETIARFALAARRRSATVASGCARKIGDECTTAADCNPNGTRSCDSSQPGGYCTIQGCDETSCPDEAACIRYFPAQYLTKPCDPTRDPAMRRDRLCRRRVLPARRAVRAAVDRAALLREDLLQRRRLPRRVRVPAGGNARQHGAHVEPDRDRAFLRARRQLTRR